jgi:hypothetical protein
MGLGAQNPRLFITTSTNVSQLISEFISLYELPHSVYDVIFNEIYNSFQSYNLNLDSLANLKTSPLTLTLHAQDKNSISNIEVRNNSERYQQIEQVQRK